MKFVKYLLTGIVFGIILTKAEVISWFRIYEMFSFESFHMYGVIGSAVGIGMVIMQVIKRTKMKDLFGEDINLPTKPLMLKANVIGGVLFGVGWAMTGACPGPLFILLGNGFWVVGVTILSALLGTYVYGALRSRLPH